MGHIKEPKGIDFIINSGPLTDEDKKIFSEFIRKSKAKLKRRKVSSKKAKSSRKQKEKV